MDMQAAAMPRVGRLQGLQQRQAGSRQQIKRHTATAAGSITKAEESKCSSSNSPQQDLESQAAQQQQQDATAPRAKAGRSSDLSKMAATAAATVHRGNNQ
jgi:hypothetical protein